MSNINKNHKYHCTLINKKIQDNISESLQILNNIENNCVESVTDKLQNLNKYINKSKAIVRSDILFIIKKENIIESIDDIIDRADIPYQAIISDNEYIKHMIELYDSFVNLKMVISRSIEKTTDKDVYSINKQINKIRENLYMCLDIQENIKKLLF